MKRRIIIALVIVSTLLSVALAATLLADPFMTLTLGRIRLFYAAGRVGGEYRSGEALTGPNEVIGYRGDESYYVNFFEIGNWRRQLPAATGGQRFGIAWSTRYAEREGSGMRLAEKCYTVNVGAEYLLAVVALLAGFSIAAYLKIRSGDKRLAAGLCLVCGYDLRASGNQCPECGTPRTTSPIAPAPF